MLKKYTSRVRTTKIIEDINYGIRALKISFSYIDKQHIIHANKRCFMYNLSAVYIEKIDIYIAILKVSLICKVNHGRIRKQ